MCQHTFCKTQKGGYYMEIEKKYLIRQLPESMEQYPHHLIEQGYLNTDPVIRVRRQDDTYYLTYKGSGMLAREEYNLPLNAESYKNLIKKADGTIINKKRYCIPFQEKYTIELDVFSPPFAPLVLAEVEFPSIEEAEAFIPPEWFGEEVTFQPEYHNSNMALGNIPTSFNK